jgi:hypothetical protein
VSAKKVAHAQSRCPAPVVDEELFRRDAGLLGLLRDALPLASEFQAATEGMLNVICTVGQMDLHRLAPVAADVKVRDGSTCPLLALASHIAAHWSCRTRS